MVNQCELNATSHPTNTLRKSICTKLTHQNVPWDLGGRVHAFLDRGRTNTPIKYFYCVIFIL